MDIAVVVAVVVNKQQGWLRSNEAGNTYFAWDVSSSQMANESTNSTTTAEQIR